MEMETKTKNNSLSDLEKYQHDEAVRRRIQQMALAVLTRAKDAQIPPQQMRITKEKFFDLLDVGYFQYRKMNKDVVKKMCNDLFTSVTFATKAPFILIDGGDMYSRKQAGFALLFRLIAWDKIGMHHSCAKITHSLQTWESQGMSRNEFAEELKSYDVLFISECINTLFKPALEAGSFMDEILESREANGKITILSFQQIIPAMGIESTARTSDNGTGQYLMMFSESDSERKNLTNILRIRVK